MESNSLWLPKYEQLMQALYEAEDGNYQELGSIERLDPFLHDQLERYG